MNEEALTEEQIMQMFSGGQSTPENTEEGMTEEEVMQMATESEWDYSGPIPQRKSNIPQAQPQQFEERGVLETIGDEAKGVLETLLGIGSSAITAPAAQVAGLVEGTVKGIQEDMTPMQRAQLSQQLSQDYMQKMAYQPKSEEGLRNIQAIGEIAQPLEALGPLAGQMQALKSLTPRSPLTELTSATKEGLKKTGQTTKSGFELLASKIPERIKVKTLKEEIKNNPNNKDLVKYKIEKTKSGREKISKDNQALDAVKQGWSEKALAPIKNSSIENKKQMMKMLDIHEKASKDAKFALNNRPTDIIGDSIEKRINFISNTRKIAGKELDKIATKNLRGNKIDYTNEVSNFRNSLSGDGGLGVVVKSDKTGKQVLDFKNSDISMDKNGIKIINDIYSKLQNNLDAEGLHKIKKELNSKLSFSKRQANPVSNEADLVLKQLRTEINEKISNNFPGYKAVNLKYGESLDALNQIQKAAGTSIDFDKPNAGKALGTSTRKLLSNSVNRVNMSNSIDNLDNIAKKYGGKFNDDIGDMVIFADELETRFKTQATTSIQGVAEKALDNSQMTMTGLAIEGAKAGVKKLKGVNDENAYKAMRKILLEKNQ